tara:strand:- start:663 stop:1505 length:843 start_codon:yes stop_codon:yes gene_type:complete
MLSQANILDLYYKIDRKTTKLDEDCLTILYEIKNKLGIEIINNFGVPEIKKKNNKFIKTNIDASLDKVIGSLKINLNKLSDKNYDKVSENILNILTSYDDNIFFKDVSALIFSIVSKNNLNCNILSKLYCELCDKNEYFKELLYLELNNYCDTFKNIEYVSPNNNYDKYCEYVKLNENKISLSLFFLECYKLDLLSLPNIITLIENSINLLEENIEYDNNYSVCEEIVQNIYILMKGLIKSKKNSIEPIINIFIDNNFSKYKSFNNKIRFKIMDIKDLLK